MKVSNYNKGKDFAIAYIAEKEYMRMQIYKQGVAYAQAYVDMHKCDKKHKSPAIMKSVGRKFVQTYYRRKLNHLRKMREFGKPASEEEITNLLERIVKSQVEQ